MKTAVVFVCLLVAVAAKPQFGLGTANGFGNAGSFQGQTHGFFGGSGFQGSNANAGVSILLNLLLVNMDTRLIVRYCYPGEKITDQMIILVDVFEQKCNHSWLYLSCYHSQAGYLCHL